METTTTKTSLTTEEALARIHALREIQRETGCITRRAQSYLLGSLSEDVLTEVSFRLKAGALYGDNRFSNR